MHTSPLALFITWTVYGTHLPGDLRGWRHRTAGEVRPQPLLERWHRDRLQHDVITLNSEMRNVAVSAIHEICEFRKWSCWGLSVRTNHVHVVLTAVDYAPTLVRDQLKAKTTIELRLRFPVWVGRPVWTAKGDIEFLDKEDEIDKCVSYVNEAQDRKGRDQQ